MYMPIAAVGSSASYRVKNFLWPRCSRPA